jgi:hypothetical protein
MANLYERIATTIENGACCLARLNAQRIRNEWNGIKTCDEDMCKLINLWLTLDVLRVLPPLGKGDYNSDYNSDYFSSV